MQQAQDRSKREHRRRRQRIRPSGIAGGAVLLLMLAACLLTVPWTFGSAENADSARYEAQNLDAILRPPWWASSSKEDDQEKVSDTFFFGSDRLGRDLLVRCLAGGEISLLIGIAAAAIAVIIGTLYGTVSAYFGGRTDAVMMRIVDIFYGLPYILLVVLLAVAVDGVMTNFESRSGALAEFVVGHRAAIRVITLLAAIGGVSWLTMARVIRGQVLSLKEQPFMEACRAIGVPLNVQFRRHLLPNLLGPIVVYATLTVPQAILQESFLSFLGIGVQPPLPSWGNLAAEGLSELNPVKARWWLLLWPCVFLAMTLLSLNFVGEALREAFDPKRRTRS